MGLISETVTIKPSGKSIQYYKEKGYDAEYHKPLGIKVEDLPKYSNIKVLVCCDICGKQKEITYSNYLIQVNRGNYYACKDCINIKRKSQMFEKYGVEHTMQLPETVNHIRKTCQEKYGTDWASQSIEVQEKIKQTNLQKIGVENPFMLQEFQDKGKQTKLERYGTTNTSQLDEVKDKSKTTSLKKWGYENPAQSPIVQEKMKKTNLKVWGFEYASQSPIVQDKIRETNLKIYGVPIASQNPIIQEKMQNTCIEHFGVPNAMQSPEIRAKVAQSSYVHNSQKVSKQQLYLYNLYGGKLNYPCEVFNLDILLDNIDIEYDGSGHDLSTRFDESEKNKFFIRKIVRDKTVKKHDYKSMRIISRKDKLPSDKVLLDILDQSKQYFQDYPNHSWREWDIDNGIFRDAEHKDGEPYDYGILHKIKQADLERNAQVV